MLVNHWILLCLGKTRKKQEVNGGKTSFSNHKGHIHEVNKGHAVGKLFLKILLSEKHCKDL